MHVKHLLLAGLFVASAAVGANADDRWEVGVGAEVQLNPGAPDNGSATVALGGSVQALRAVSERTSLGVRLEVLRLFPHAETYEYDARQHDLVFALRHGRPRPDRPTPGFDLGIGMSRYAGSVDIPVVPGCWGCGRYSGVTYRPTLQVGGDVDVPIGCGWAIRPRARATVMLIRGTSTDVHNFLPGGLGFRVDAVVVRRL